MARRKVTLENNLGQEVDRIEREYAGRLVSRGNAFWLESGRLRLADRRHAGSDVTRRSAATITFRQLVAASCAGSGESAEERRGRYERERIRVWPEIGDTRAVLAGGRA